MKKLFPAILLMAALSLSACGIAKTDTGTTKNEEAPKTESAKSLKELLGLGTSQKCTFETITDGAVVKSEIIVSGKKFKQTSEITNEEGKMNVYSVSDGVYYYSWSDVSKEMGAKMKIEDIENDSKDMPTGNEPVKTEGQQIDMDEKIDYKCTPATLTDKDLLVPTDVKFVDYADILKGFQNMDSDQLKNLAPKE